MSIFDRFKKKKEAPKQAPDQKQKAAQAASGKDQAATDRGEAASVPAPAAKKKEISENLKGESQQAHRVLLKPLITEKATEFGALNKYVFQIDPTMNKIEVKKAIRSIYHVDPVKVTILNFSGKKVRFGRLRGRRKAWKKAVVTLREGDKIEVYEGV